MSAKRTGPPYRRVVGAFWSDPDVKRPLSLEQKGFLLYLITNGHSHPCGIYGLPPLYVRDELDMEETRLRELFEGPMTPFALYDWRTEEVFVVNMGKHQIGETLLPRDNRVRWVVNHLQGIHSQSLLRRFANRYSDWGLPWKEILIEGSEDPCADAEMEGASQPLQKGLPEGLRKPDPDPDPDPGSGLGLGTPSKVFPASSTSPPSTGRGKRREGLAPEVWRDRVRSTLRTECLLGDDEATLPDGTVVGIGLLLTQFCEMSEVVERDVLVEMVKQVRKREDAPGPSEAFTLRWLRAHGRWGELESAARGSLFRRTPAGGVLAVVRDLVVAKSLPPAGAGIR